MNPLLEICGLRRTCRSGVTYSQVRFSFWYFVYARARRYAFTGNDIQQCPLYDEGPVHTQGTQCSKSLPLGEGEGGARGFQGAVYPWKKAKGVRYLATFEGVS